MELDKIECELCKINFIEYYWAYYEFTIFASYMSSDNIILRIVAFILINLILIFEIPFIIDKE